MNVKGRIPMDGAIYVEIPSIIFFEIGFMSMVMWECNYVIISVSASIRTKKKVILEETAFVCLRRQLALVI
jgi:hypothetical protein